MNANKQDAGGLPELPEPQPFVCAQVSDGARWVDPDRPYYTASQMRAYGEQCRAASVASGEIESVIERLATEAAACITVLGRAPEASDVRVMLDAAKLLRALSRGVPEEK